MYCVGTNAHIDTHTDGLIGRYIEDTNIPRYLNGVKFRLQVQLL